WVKSYTSQYGLEKFNVAVSVTDSTPSSFTVISGSNPLEAPTKWTKFSYDLSAYSNQQVYIAVNCVSNDAFLFMLDDMEVDPGSDTPALPSSIIQNFDSIADFSLDFSPWGTIDVNGGMTYAIQNVSFPNSGMPMAWINFNPTVLTNSPANMIAHSGTKFAACFSSMPPNNPNDKWLISPRLQLGVNSKMELWAMTYNSVYGAEKFNICVSTGGNTVSDFTVISKSGGEQAPDNWTKMTFDLSAYDGEKVYIGIQCITNDGFVFMLDDISINSVVGIENHPGDTDWQIYPNPSAGKILLEKHSGMEKDTRFILTDISGNILGDMSASSFTGEKIEMDLSGFSSGIYLLHIQNNHSSVIKKIVITH
ncbi:MAG: choice-of-anchor J domain-containing protein, partial [Bacteroidota bacterium]|nr:choice-of-anchor J domain-containing protein [Bacteroidota bacterium]